MLPWREVHLSLNLAKLSLPLSPFSSSLSLSVAIILPLSPAPSPPPISQTGHRPGRRQTIRGFICSMGQSLPPDSSLPSTELGAFFPQNLSTSLPGGLSSGVRSRRGADGMNAAIRDGPSDSSHIAGASSVAEALPTPYARLGCTDQPAPASERPLEQGLWPELSGTANRTDSFLRGWVEERHRNSMK